MVHFIFVEYYSHIFQDLLLRKWKDLSDMITVECDGQDITQKLKEHRVHSVLFANIPSFSSGIFSLQFFCSILIVVQIFIRVGLCIL